MHYAINNNEKQQKIQNLHNGIVVAQSITAIIKLQHITKCQCQDGGYSELLVQHFNRKNCIDLPVQ